MNEESESTHALAVLGTLIARLNPYTDHPIDENKLSTGQMALETSPGGKVVSISDLAVEVEVYPGTQWTFKGQQISIATALRIPYKFAVLKDSKLAYWQEEYLLIGYTESIERRSESEDHKETPLLLEGAAKKAIEEISRLLGIKDETEIIGRALGTELYLLQKIKKDGARVVIEDKNGERAEVDLS